MFRQFVDMSLREKLYIIFGAMIIANVAGITIGQIVFARMQVGGRAGVLLLLQTR